MTLLRRYLSMSHGINHSNTPGNHPHLKVLTKNLDKLAPRFEIDGSQIDIIHEPDHFYQILKQRISNANQRVFLSSLYIGKSQDELVDCLSKALDSKPNLKVHILTDALRGTREEPARSSASLLTQLLIKHESRVDIRMYHTPNLNGALKALVPRRFNEAFGLQHMKIYGFDDEVILSGANLSTDYFTNRQDRYYLFKSKKISDYYFRVQKTVSQLSYKLKREVTKKAKFKLIWPSSNPAPEPYKNPKLFIEKSSKILKELLSISENPSNHLKKQTYVYAVSQFTPLLRPDVSTEKRSIFHILDFIKNGKTKWNFTAGYFNILPEIKSKLIDASSSSGTVITASPLANGFYQSKGVSKYLPDAYMYLAKLFLIDVKNAGRADNIYLKEWKRGTVNTVDGWSYHAKGIWATSYNEEDPSVTIIGSSNFTRRAYSFDLETNAIIVTSDETLKQKMREELMNLNQYTRTLQLQDFEVPERKFSKLLIWATTLLGKRL